MRRIRPTGRRGDRGEHSIHHAEPSPSETTAVAGGTDPVPLAGRGIARRVGAHEDAQAAVRWGSAAFIE